MRDEVRRFARALPWRRWLRRAPGKRPVCASADVAAQRRARRLVLVSASSPVLGVVTLILTAFGVERTDDRRGADRARLAGGRHRRPPEPVSSRRSATSTCSSPSRPPSLTAIGFHGASDGSLSLQPVGRQANEGLLARLWRRIAGSGNDSTALVPARGHDPGHERARCRRRPRNGRLRARATARSSRSATSSSTAKRRRRIDLRPTRVAVGDRLRRSTCGPTRRSPSGRRCSPRRRSSARSSTLAAVERQALAEHARARREQRRDRRVPGGRIAALSDAAE